MRKENRGKSREDKDLAVRRCMECMQDKLNFLVVWACVSVRATRSPDQHNVSAQM